MQVGQAMPSWHKWRTHKCLQSSNKWIIVEKFGHLISASFCIVSIYVHNGIGLVNNQDYIVLVFARMHFIFALLNAGKECPPKIGTIAYWELVHCHIPLHRRIHAILFCQKVQPSNVKWILLFMVMRVRPWTLNSLWCLVPRMFKNFPIDGVS